MELEFKVVDLTGVLVSRSIVFNSMQTVQSETLLTMKTHITLFLTLLICSINVQIVSAQEIYKVKNTELNVRNLPSTGKIVGKLFHGDLIVVEAINNGWARFKYKGKNAYVSASYIELQNKAPEIKSSFETDVKKSITEEQSIGNETIVKFVPVPLLSDNEIKNRVYKADPYTLYRKGSVAEYAFSDGNEQVPLPYLVGGVKAFYVRQGVSEVNIVQGLYQSVILQSYYNQSGDRILEKRTECVEQLFPTEIAPNGVFHLTHDILNDLYYNIKSRGGYAFMIPYSFFKGINLTGSSIIDDVLIMNLTRKTITTNYTNVYYHGEEKITTPAGTFKCVKITYEYNSTYKHVGNNINSYNATIWIARGIGLVKAELENQIIKGKSDFIFTPTPTIYLNRLLLN